MGAFELFAVRSLIERASRVGDGYDEGEGDGCEECVGVGFPFVVVLVPMMPPIRTGGGVIGGSTNGVVILDLVLDLRPIPSVTPTRLPPGVRSPDGVLEPEA